MLRGFGLLALIVGACLVVGPARADEAVWSVAGREVLRVHGLKTGMTALQRVEELDQRVNEILSKGDGTLPVSDITLKRDKGAVWIAVRGDLLVTVAPEDAQANKTTRERLGKTWLENLRKTLPQLAPRENKGGA